MSKFNTGDQVIVKGDSSAWRTLRGTLAKVSTDYDGPCEYEGCRNLSCVSIEAPGKGGQDQSRFYNIDRGELTLEVNTEED